MPSQTTSILVVVVAASAWGLFWLPLRAFEENGLTSEWVAFWIFATSALFLLACGAFRKLRNMSIGFGSAGTGALVGGAVALYSASILETDVARALILFYVTPVWSTFIEVLILGSRLTLTRSIALLMGLGGLLAILGIGETLPLPKNPGDGMALLAGFLWACGTIRIRIKANVETFEYVFSFFFYGSFVALILAMLQVGGEFRLPSVEQARSLGPWLALTATGFLVPVTWGLLWGSKHIEAGRLGILLQLEAIIGIGSAAWLTDEPFGLAELLGTVLVSGAGVLDVLGDRKKVGPT